ncbi:uncharacterized protein LOC100377427 [Saccoglossus kowalevskii]|uniref:Uncharacterized protein LOC100377427 n=1 Tax=Saccoglossus kowalevskii TaxID=10224 RepID=A0ABM0GS57_SACKO|nr:PREDICTED: uncharacterized protein LOC100377427 [Saccoglossus kowalevskii]
MAAQKFKLDAKKMIAAHNSRNRPISPESSSNWDSSEPEDDAGPRIDTSSSEEDDRESVKRSPINMKPTPAARVNSDNKLRPEKFIKAQGGLTPQGGRTPTKTSPALSLKNSLKPGVNMFVDRSQHNSDEDDSSYSAPTPKRRVSKTDLPPYDFKGVANSDKGRVVRETQPPGKSRKGNTYDRPPPRVASPEGDDEFSWADSDAEERTLASLRADLVKNSPTRSDVNTPPSRENNNNSKTLPVRREVQSSEQSAQYAQNPKRTRDKHQRSMSQQQLVSSSQINLESSGLQNPAYNDNFGPSDDDGKDRASFAYSENVGYIYYYEHGSRRYYDGRGAQSDAYMAGIADKSAAIIKRGLQEFFHALRIIVEALLLLVLESSRFVFQNLVQFFLKEFFIVIGDHCLRPMLSALYNHVVQPIVVFSYNVGVGFKRILYPFIEILRDIMLVVAIPLRAFRLFELNWKVPSDVNDQRYRQIQQV